MTPHDTLLEALAELHRALAAGEALEAAEAVARAVAATQEAARSSLSPAPIAKEASARLDECAALAHSFEQRLRASMEELSASSRAHSAYRGVR